MQKHEVDEKFMRDVAELLNYASAEIEYNAHNDEYIATQYDFDMQDAADNINKVLSQRKVYKAKVYRIKRKKKC